MLAEPRFKGSTPGTAMVKWLMSNPNLTAAVIATKSFNQLQENFTAATKSAIAAADTNPLSVPVTLFQKSHRPGRRAAPGRRLIVLIPGLHFPPGILLRAQWLARIVQLRRLGRVDLSRIPQITLILIKQSERTRHQDTIRGLLQVPRLRPRRQQNPAQTRRRRIDPKRIGEVFAPKMGDLDSAARLHLCARARQSVKCRSSDQNECTIIPQRSDDFHSIGNLPTLLTHGQLAHPHECEFRKSNFLILGKFLDCCI